tara:strand:+ start:3718 stop:4569 length:852 start_codon:yes stop_codon:yes gene_type:complete
MSKKTLENFIDRHLGERIFILGAGPMLNDLTEKEIKKIEKEEVSIGVNYSHAQVKPTYWIAGGAPCQVSFALEYLPSHTTPFFHQSPHEEILFPEVERLVHTSDELAVENLELPRRPKNNAITGGYNCLLDASHLAYIMGASEIVFVGFDQINHLHFYNLWSESRQEELKNKFRFLQKKYPEIDFGQVLGIEGEWTGVSKKIFDPANSGLKRDMSVAHFKSIEACKSKTGDDPGSFNCSRNLILFKSYVKQFLRDGIKLYTTAEKGIIVDGGVKTITLDELLK